MRLLFITHNKGKLNEVRSILRGRGIEVEHREIEYEEPRGDDTTEIARKSATGLHKLVKGPFFIDDTGIFVDALNGFPGPYSAFVLGKIGYTGILGLLNGNTNRKAYFKSTIAYADENGVTTFDGITNGAIAAAPRGNNGFGYDPIFIPEGYSETFAEMGEERKNAASPRRKALDKFAEWISKKGGKGI